MTPNELVAAIRMAMEVEREACAKVCMNYRATDAECKGCGATAEDRRHNRPGDPQGLSDCPHCGAEKCCMCDMGDDVECGNCDTGDEP